MKFKTVITMIPDTPEAEEAFDASVLKIMRAHKAGEGHFFEVIDTPYPTKEEPKKRGPKPKAKNEEETAKDAE